MFLLTEKNFLQQFEMREHQQCSIVCKKVLSEKEVNELKEKIEDEYQVNM